MHPKSEFFALDVPYHLAKDVGVMMNFLSEKPEVLPHQTVQLRGFPEGMIIELANVSATLRTELMKTHLCQMHPDAKIIQLCPIGGWPEAEENAPADGWN